MVQIMSLASNAVYLLEDRVTGAVTNNHLIAYTYEGNTTGDDAVSASRVINVEGND